MTLVWGDESTVFDRLEGSWDLDRHVGGQASMTGVAVFLRLDPDTLAYREEARVRLADGTTLDAHREYRFARAPRGFTVYFAEHPPRLFHDIEIAHDGDALTGSALHLCSPDTYDSDYRFLADGRFTIRHTVSGPRKDYVSTTLFQRREAR